MDNIKEILASMCSFLGVGLTLTIIGHFAFEAKKIALKILFVVIAIVGIAYLLTGFGEGIDIFTWLIGVFGGNL